MVPNDLNKPLVWAGKGLGAAFVTLLTAAQIWPGPKLWIEEVVASLHNPEVTALCVIGIAGYGFALWWSRARADNNDASKGLRGQSPDVRGVFHGPVTASGSTGDTIHVVNSGPGVAVGKGDVYLGKPQFELTDDMMAEILASIDRTTPVALAWRAAGRTDAMMKRLMAYLESNGVLIGGKVTWADKPFFPLAGPIKYYPNGLRTNGMIIMDGLQAVVLDAKYEPD